MVILPPPHTHPHTHTPPALPLGKINSSFLSRILLFKLLINYAKWGFNSTALGPQEEVGGGGGGGGGGGEEEKEREVREDCLRRWKEEEVCIGGRLVRLQNLYSIMCKISSNASVNSCHC